MTGDYEAGDVNTISEHEEDVEDVEDDDLEYEEGDVNARSGAPHDEDRGNRAESESTVPLGVLTYLARSLADEPDSVVIDTERRRGSVVLRVHLAPEDMGRVIGRRGRTAQAIRTLVSAAGAREGTQVSVDIVDD